MRSRLNKLWWAAAILCITALGREAQVAEAKRPQGAAPCPDRVRTPVAPGKHEVATAARIDLPGVPEFPAILVAENGHSVTEMRRLGAKYLGQSVKVTGYVTWKYSCVDVFMKEFQTQAAVAGKRLSEAKARKMAEQEYFEHRERCDRPHFYIAEQPNASHQKSIWVVDVPRPPEGAAEEQLAKEDPAAWPAPPSYAVGDQVVVEGQWSTRSPKGFINLSGLIVYAGFTNLTAHDAVEPRR